MTRRSWCPWDDCTWKEPALSLEPFKGIDQKRKFFEDLNAEFARRALKQKAKPVFSAQPQQQHLFPALATTEQGKALGLLQGQPTGSPIILCTHIASKELCERQKKGQGGGTEGSRTNPPTQRGPSKDVKLKTGWVAPGTCTLFPG